MRLAAADPARAADHISKVYEWKYSEATTIAKALVGTGSALVVLLLLPIIQPDKAAPLSEFGLVVVVASALVMIVLGSGLYLGARRYHLEFLAAQTLLAHLVDIHPFLSLYEESKS